VEEKNSVGLQENQQGKENFSQFVQDEKPWNERTLNSLRWRHK
jgi:hypothetical protein